MNSTRNQFARSRGTARDYDVEVQDGDVVITRDGDNGINVSMEGDAVPIPDHVDLPDQASASEADVIGYVVTESGKFLAIDNHETVDEQLRVHLGWYYSDTDTLDLVEFVER